MQYAPARLPIHLKIGRHETAESYLRRLLDANFVGSTAEGSLRLWASRQGRKSDTPGLLIDALSGMPPARFDESGGWPVTVRRGHRCARCLLGMEEQFECRLCARGAVIAQRPHGDGFVCERHRLWVGPHAPAAAQAVVRGAVVRAHTHWRRMRRRGLVSVATTAELIAVVRRSSIGRDVHRPEEELFLLAVRIWSELLRAANLRFVTAPSTPSPAAYDRVRRCVATALGDDDAVVADGVWLLIRPIVFYRRAQLEGSQHGFEWDEHFGVAPPLDGPFPGPLQPFARYNEQLRTCARSRWEDFLLRSLAPHEQRLLRDYGSAGSSSECAFICPQGHCYRTSLNGVSSSHRDRYEGCGICAHHRADPGVNSLDVTHFRVASRWHPDRNVDLRPRDVLAGSDVKAWWLCELGHSYYASITSQTRPNSAGCPYCSGSKAIPGVTGIDPARPDLIELWDYERNALSPKLALPHSALPYWWLCPEGHSYFAPVARVALGRKCGVCTGRQVLVEVNDLCSQFPEVAAEWHPTRNGDLQPSQVFMRSGCKAWWLCPLGHEWQTGVRNRTEGHTGCAVCSGKRLKPGFNTLADARPELAEQWHSLLNGELRPTDVGLASGAWVWWVCPSGHAFAMTVAARVHSPKCRFCSNKWVLPGVNDVATRFPTIIDDWDVVRNKPAVVSLPGDARRHWLCRDGHVAFESVRNRFKTGGCPRCPPSERAGCRPVPSGASKRPYEQIAARFAAPAVRTASTGATRREHATDYPDRMSRTPRATPAELAPAPWPAHATDDPVAEAVRQFVLRLQAEIGDRSVRSVAAMANVDQNALRRLLLGLTWPDLATLARLELALNADLWARPNGTGKSRT